MATRTRRSVAIHYERVGGAGPVAVLVQGLGLSGTFWFDTPGRVAGAGFQVLVPDNRGTGRSDVPAGPYSMADFADDLAGVLDDAAVERAYVCGISMGGMIAQNFALRHPDRVQGLVLMATTPGLTYGKLPPLLSLSRILAMPMLDQKRAGRALVKLLLPRSEWKNAKERLGGFGDAMRAEPTRPATFFSQIAAITAHSTGPRLGDLACPVHVMTGAEDALVRPENSHILARLIPGATLEVLPGTGHAIMAIDPDAPLRGLQAVRTRVEAGRLSR